MERRESENRLPLNRPLAPAARAPSLIATQSMRACDACSQPAPAGTIKPALTTRGLNNVISVSQSGKVSRVHPGKPDHKLQIPGFLVAPFPYISPDVGPPLGTGKPPSHAYTAM